jgi:HPt (histidine-containing phosphotransfer) domain-containing protein
MTDSLAAFRARFIERAAADRDRLAQARARLSLPEGDPVAAAAEIERLAHGLAGAGGTFGFPEVSVAAEEVEAAALAQPVNEDVLMAAVGRLLIVLGRLG